ncbi:sigma-70 family RNA polymerase sigma factor [Luteolibacter sp. SL250]|uniref:RNA polymerase sigma factor n=1 Tax=Luteolibacter sp. SL250 TaxID=2995170 RepID=UPI00227108AC|nr:sigma-70 family RNA polymerase sigma factor [Luteolibacter sp. SL250]WAC18273.1 sigma-70 family RNA polymerase sigma factor [Luteolibacter sp. SL250]
MSDGRFATTRWTLVMNAGLHGSAEAETALAALCETYWFPIYSFIRRHGRSKEDAEDLTQAFFAALLDRRAFGQLDQEQGKFRGFLLATVKNFLSNARDRERALKRGGGIAHLSLDWESADSRFAIACGDGRTPDEEFDREWALTLLARVLSLLEDEFSHSGRAEEFGVLKGHLTGKEAGMPYEDAARLLDMEAGAVRVRVHRLRKRYRELLKQEISSTLVHPAMVEEELSALMGAFR